MLAIWVVATLGLTVLAWQIVSTASDEVNDQPISAVEVASPSTSAPAISTTASGATPTSATTTVASTSATETSSATSSTASTSVSTSWATKTIPTSGGTVVVRYRPSEVVLETAAPAVGYSYEIKESGPTEVEVEFQAQGAAVDVRVRWRDGQLSVEVDDD